MSYLASDASYIGVLGHVDEGVGKRAWDETVVFAYVSNALTYGAATTFFSLRRTALGGS